MSKLLKSSGGIGAATMLSRILGLVREFFYASFMGISPEAAAFFYAFMAPNLFRRLLGEGALTAAFIPIFKAKEKNDGETAMWRAANAVLSALVVAAGGVAVVAMIGITIALACHIWSQETRLMLQLMRLMFPYMTLACVAAVLIGICNARGHFFIPALGAALLNVVMIASVLLLAPRLGATLSTQVFGLAIGVIVAGIAQASFQLPTLHKEGFRFQWISPWGDPIVREVLIKMIPSSIGVAAFQINVLVTQSLAFGENGPIVAIFQYAVRLMELPQGVVGLSLATFLLPTLSSLAVEKNYGQFRATLREGVSYLIYINLLASVLLFTLAEPIVRLLFQHGSFRAAATEQVSFALACLVPGLISFSLVNILARAFYALEDVKTPAKISIFCLVLNLAFTAFLLFGFHLGAGALGVANSLSSFCNLALLTFALRKKLRTLEMAPCVAQFPSLAGACVAAGVISYGLRRIWTHYIGHTALPQRLGEVFVPLLTASVAYLALTVWLKVPSAREVVALARSRVK
ncbi:MAG TPA: murein biosynthesis integral membrane protein MurJ [Verrucomicrobiae bacterium]|jgi:putative peptidoglycan lipid II flippase|nr:murein biosynthesis integral membrane protein MurJ [Verrucomicrobiae bacterium]